MCLLDSFRRVQALGPLQHLSFVVVCLLLTWLQRLEGVTDAYVLSVCDQGKHQSVYMGRVVWLAMELLKRIVGFQAEVLYFWVAQERGVLSQQGHLPGQPQRQHPDCCADVVQGWHRCLNSSRYVSVSLTDKLHAGAFGCEGTGFDARALQRDDILRHSNATNAMRSPQRHTHCRATTLLDPCLPVLLVSFYGVNVIG